MTIVQHISPPVLLPPELRTVAGLVAESYTNPVGREFLVMGVWGKAYGNEQVLYLGWCFTDTAARAGRLERIPVWDAVRLPAGLRGVLNAVLSLYCGQLRAIVTTDCGDGNVNRQQLHVVTLAAAGIED
jgi:hypothetical protein